MAGRVVHFELPYDDRERAATFYRELFGWDLQTWGDGDYTLVVTGPSGERGPTEPGYVNGGMGPRSQTLSAPVVVVHVPDIDATLAEVEAGGGVVVQPRTSVGDLWSTAYFRDPEGNVVGLWQSAPDE